MWPVKLSLANCRNTTKPHVIAIFATESAIDVSTKAQVKFVFDQ